MPEFNSNLWAPWRAEFIRSLEGGSPQPECFLCAYIAKPSDDAANRVICRTAHSLVVMNRYPYTNGHLLVAPLTHRGELGGLAETELLELVTLARDCLGWLQDAVGAEGYNVGMNFGRCAGAGLPDHLHVHVVPRWSGDTNFMSTVAEARVIPESMDEVYARLRKAAEEKPKAQNPKPK